MPYTPYQDDEIPPQTNEDGCHRIDRALDRAKVEDDQPELVGLVE